ncbi:Uncharacterized protein ZC84.1 [Toxocara canis]|uniref:Uncharacterized protein ZC84.1 n=1 Tax=Toxocara canis TaxID=6265 RepID=A0A0B2UT39_TOXCA|nr:Uncharacterized protein ZC84.1 [Toxocara canis]
MRVVLFLMLLTMAVLGEQPCFEARDKGTEGCDQPQPGTYFYYDGRAGLCQPFYYVGCGGTKNRFESAEKCKSACGGARDDHKPMTIKRCKSKTLAARGNNGEYVKCGSCPEGYVCNDELCCPTKEYLCALPYDAGKFGLEEPMQSRFFYNSKFGNCMLFTYFGTKGNANNFLNYYDCAAFCKHS